MSDIRNNFDKLRHKTAEQAITCGAFRDMVLELSEIRTNYKYVLCEVARGLSEDLENLENDFEILDTIYKKNDHDIQYFRDDVYHDFKEKHYGRKYKLSRFQGYLGEILKRDPSDRSLMNDIRITDSEEVDYGFWL